ncbi:hypothetical protein [Vibrio sp.]|uniref:hypothetical protein n=1 Tax=Vibrio sp. TaxID=678 RepID=UPI003D13749A
MNNESTTVNQADGLRCLMKRQVSIDKVKAIRVELRQAIIAGKYKDAETLMALLTIAQEELEETYWA